ncbi:hypothetical protein B0J11DRAFT_534954 [Dendryphion nanum]|uniref:Secreted protein n=1 Tax=Dendryphion nanum TaxID=256645 RepID=A0A9P9IH87_9PLEO|nr:hypothetical protein B0J11DRAFT_534954 [Dendryphion nanum]
MSRRAKLLVGLCFVFVEYSWTFGWSNPADQSLEAMRKNFHSQEVVSKMMLSACTPWTDTTRSRNQAGLYIVSFSMMRKVCISHQAPISSSTLQ